MVMLNFKYPICGSQLGVPNITVEKYNMSVFTGKKIKCVRVLDQKLDLHTYQWWKITIFGSDPSSKNDKNQVADWFFA